MAGIPLNKINKPQQYLFTLLTIALVAGLCYFFSPHLDYKVVAFILLFTVSIFAMFFDILPVLMATLLSALIWDFFFIPPRFTLQVGSTEDIILLLMYFIIALLNVVLTYKVKQFEKKALQKEEKASIVKLYNTLLNSLSHELRTPIATIIGATDNLQNDSAKLTAGNREELLSEISKAAIRLNEQVENLLNMSRLESGFIKPHKDWVDITELVYDVVKRVEENNITQQLNIQVHPSIPLFKLDKGMLEQILYNLVNNARVYTGATCIINISASCDNDILQLIVADNGKGFPPEKISIVFDKFYRLKNTLPGGTGLGLSIVKGFAEALGGSVQLENILTGGAKFTVTIPAETSYLKNLKNE